jgi:LuxR family maltose regulon positive regulatory protein
MSRVFLEWNDLSAAMDAVSKGMELSKRGAGIDIGVVGTADLVRTLLALGELEKAQEAILKLKEAYPELAAARLPAIEAMILIVKGDLVAARSILEAEGFSSEDSPDFNQLLTQRLVAKVLVEEGKNEEALDFLHRLKAFTVEKEVTRNTIEILILQAIALQAMDKEHQAIEALREALLLGKPEGFVRTFINEGAAMGKLLRKAKAHGVQVDYVSKLLDELEKEGFKERPLIGAPLSRVKAGQATLVEPLTERELDVLRLLRTDLSAPEIADHRYVAVSTVRSHTKSIYSKLEVHGRREAVAQAEELGLV